MDEVKGFVLSGVNAIGWLSAAGDGAIDELIDALPDAHRTRLFERIRRHNRVALVSIEERELAKAGALSQAVRSWRARTGLGLGEAKAAFVAEGCWNVGDMPTRRFE